MSHILSSLLPVSQTDCNFKSLGGVQYVRKITELSFLPISFSGRKGIQE